jgi:hypothetical protein
MSALGASIEAEVDLPGGPFTGVVSSLDGGTVYISLVKSRSPDVNSIAVVDIATATVTEEILLGDQGAGNSSPRELYLSPDGRWIVHMAFTNDATVIDTTDNSILGTVPGVGKGQLVWESDSQVFWTRESGTDTANRVEVPSLTVTHSFPIESPGGTSFQLHITPDDSAVVALASNLSGSFGSGARIGHVFDTVTMAPAGVLDIASGPLQNTVSSSVLSTDGSILYSTSGNSSPVTAHDLSTFAELWSTSAGSGNLAMRSDGTELYLVTGGNLVRLDPATGANLGNFSGLSGQQSNFSFGQPLLAPGDCAMVLPTSSDIVVVDIEDESVERLPTGQGGFYAAFTPDGSKGLAVTRFGIDTGKLWIVDLSDECGGAAPAPQLSVTGTCPGPIDIQISGLSPNGRWAISTADDAGSTVVPSGVCAGTETALGSNVTLRTWGFADSAGNVDITRTVRRAGNCPIVTQAIDFDTCATTNLFDFVSN